MKLIELFNSYREIIFKSSTNRVNNNFEIYDGLFHTLTIPSSCELNELEFNVHFIHQSGRTIDYNHNNTKIDIYFDLSRIQDSEFDDFIFCKTSFKELVVSYCAENNCDVYDIIGDGLNFSHVYTSWENYLDRIGYDEKNLVIPIENDKIADILAKRNVVWCHNKSCSGKTYSAITLLKKHCRVIVYNPCFPDSCDYNVLKIILETACNVSVLVDDMQCDVEKALELFELVYNNISSYSERNINIIFVSWSSLINNRRFQKYKSIIPTFLTKPEKYVDLIKAKVHSPSLLNVCGDNIALISAASKINIKNESEATKLLFEYFVHTTNSSKLKQIYILCVLGTYEYETPITYIGSPKLSISDLQTLKINSCTYYAGHRKICSFIAKYIESLTTIRLPEKNEIIKNYINSVANKEKWKTLKQLIGENINNDTSAVSPIWNTLYCFEDEISQQTQKDPSWQNTPSSMYFVISTASLLGVADEYINVIERLCNNITIHENHIHINYAQLKTTYDFEQIKSRMIIEDANNTVPFSYESGKDFICNLAHKNWVLGLVVGIKDELIANGKEDIFQIAINDLLSAQTDAGYWYPNRVPWVTARILISLGRAGYSMSNHHVMRGVNYLLSLLKNSNYWEAHTGGWNNIYETSSLCLEALFTCGYKISSDQDVMNVVSFLEQNKSEWMSEHNEIDGTATACMLLKIVGIKQDLLSYITDLCGRKVYEIIHATHSLDYENLQSCNTTQIAYYIIELCWYILKRDLSALLDDFLLRSEYSKQNLEENSKMKIFISYSEDSKSHIERVRKISQHLSRIGNDVYFYADEPVGTNNMEFMQKAETCDIILVIGTKKYREKAMKIKTGGVFFEANVLSAMYMNSNYNRIVPIAFDDFSEAFPTPFNINKGIRVKRITEKFLKELEIELNKRRHYYV